MAAWAAPTVTNITAAGQTIAQISEQVRNRLAGQAGNVNQSGYMNLGAVKDSSGNIADVIYDPVANIFYTSLRFTA